MSEPLKKRCTCCESKRTTAKCGSCRAPLCKACRKANQLCDACLDACVAMAEPTDKDIRRNHDEPNWLDLADLYEEHMEHMALVHSVRERITEEHELLVPA